MSHLLLTHGTAQRLPLADQSIHCIVTSPPYFGLRSYTGLVPEPWLGGALTLMPGVPPLTIPGPQTWEALEACAHVWGAPQHSAKRGHPGDRSTLVGTQTAMLSKEATGQGTTCQRCGCWCGTLGNEPTVEMYTWHTILWLREASRVLRDDGVLWLNLGDSYGGSWGNYGGDNRGHGSQRVITVGSLPSPAWKGRERERPATSHFPQGSLLLIPHRVALAAAADGWVVRNDNVWAKVAPMPESVQGWRVVEGTLRKGSWRHTRAHEFVFMLTKQMGYWANGEAVREEAVAQENRGGFHKAQRLVSTAGAKNDGFGERFEPTGGRNPRSVLTPAPSPLNLAHFASFPPGLIEPLIRATCPERVCTACGAPWAPGVTPTPTVDPSANGSRFDRGKTAHHGHVQSGERYLSSVSGLVPTCPCPPDTPWRPGVCLDPFAGSGTTLLVARALGRRSVGVEANAAYLQLARDRLGLTALEEWQGAPQPRAPADVSDLPLFRA